MALCDMSMLRVPVQRQRALDALLLAFLLRLGSAAQADCVVPAPNCQVQAPAQCGSRQATTGATANTRIAAPIAASSPSASTLARTPVSPDLGVRLTTRELQALSPIIFPDGRGLPAGQGLAQDGGRIYQSQCASCHGRHGEGLTAPELVGGDGPLSAPDADKTLATYWPFATTLFDTIARSMPPARPGRLSSDELYALCAWLLSENGLWSKDRALDARGLADIRMPNRDGFVGCAYCDAAAAPDP